MALTLYAERLWISPYVFTAFVGLKEKGLSFDVVELDLTKKATREVAFRDRSITAKVPTLEHDGFMVSESVAIAEYLAETFPFPKYPVKLFPPDFKDRARARQLMMWIRSDLMPLREERSTHTMFYGGGKPMSAACKEATEELLRVANLVIPEGKTQLFAEWCIADSDLAFCLQRLGLSGYELPKKIRAFVDAQWARPSVQAFVKHPRPATP